MYNADRIAAILMFVVVLVFASQYSDIPSFYSRVFPRSVMWILSALSAILLILSWIKPMMGELRDKREVTRVGFTVILLFGWVICIRFLGFWLAGVIFFTLMALLIEPSLLKPEKLATSVLVAAIEIGFFYMVFTRGLNVPLPKGMIFQ
ncbi:MAG: tripartite tricarboxylate transporter TctB family protein [Bacillota bacterium]|jgi:uncharacterized membrane protein YobD (UPF0266 family)|nr:tripartite tricarboxylate transporter TctB family protein [Bacillota bacterium]